MTLFLSATRSSLRATSEASASQDSANALQRVIDRAREARSVSLPSEGSVNAPGGAAASSFTTTMSNGEVINAALQLNMPASTSITVKNGLGTSIALTQYDRTANSASVLFYRGDPVPAGSPANTPGAPNASQGACLWEYDTPSHKALTLCRTIDTKTPNAVQFVRPLATQVNGATPSATQVEIKIVSGVSNLLANGSQSVQTNEATGGTDTSALTGKCVLMRNHGSDPIPSTASTLVTDHAFQPH